MSVTAPKFILLLAGAVGSGLIGGLFFAFSSFLMRALDRLSPSQAVGAMQSINVTVLNPWFLSAFFGTGAVAVLACILFARELGTPSGLFVLAGTALYVVGTIGVTMIFNVPLNQRLARIDTGADPATWEAYRVPWTGWNHVRTIAALAAAAAFVIAGWLSRTAVAG